MCAQVPSAPTPRRARRTSELTQLRADRSNDDAVSARFVRVMPTEYRRVLEQREREAREERDRELRARTAEHEALGTGAGQGQRQTRRDGDGRPERLPDHPAGGAAAPFTRKAEGGSFKVIP